MALPSFEAPLAEAEARAREIDAGLRLLDDALAVLAPAIEGFPPEFEITQLIAQQIEVPTSPRSKFIIG